MFYYRGIGLIAIPYLHKIKRKQVYRIHQNFNGFKNHEFPNLGVFLSSFIYTFVRECRVSVCVVIHDNEHDFQEYLLPLLTL